MTREDNWGARFPLVQESGILTSDNPLPFQETFILSHRLFQAIRTSTRSNCVIHYGCINFVTHAQFGVRSGLMTARDIVGMTRK